MNIKIDLEPLEGSLEDLLGSIKIVSKDIKFEDYKIDVESWVNHFIEALRKLDQDQDFQLELLHEPYVVEYTLRGSELMISIEKFFTSPREKTCFLCSYVEFRKSISDCFSILNKDLLSLGVRGHYIQIKMNNIPTNSN